MYVFNIIINKFMIKKCLYYVYNNMIIKKFRIKISAYRNVNYYYYYQEILILKYLYG